MKTQILLISLLLVSATISAQTDTVAPKGEPIDVFISEPVDTVSDEAINEFPDSLVTDEPEINEFAEPVKNDTVHIRVGNHTLEIITDDKKTHIDVDKLEDFESQWEDKDWEDNRNFKPIHHHRDKKFDGHWSGIEFGGNQLLNTTYPLSLYPEGTPEFLTTSPEKSFEVNLNLLEYSFGFSSYFGFVTGLGFNFNDYKFENRYTLTKDENGVIQPSALAEGDFRLSKLSTTFIQAPFLIEVQIPGQYDEKRIFINAGLIGGVKIHDHVKTQIGDEKKRDNGDYNISPLRWGYTARIGFEDMGVFATYYNTKLFKEGLGPETTPFTIGLALSF